MPRSMRFALAGSAILLLASCGGGGSPEPSSPNEEPLAASPKRAHALAATGASAQRQSRGNYIVQLAEPPVAAYDGGISSLRATRPAKGVKLDSDNPDVVGYRGHLAARQEAVLNSVGGSKKLHEYSYVFNGFAAEMTEAQAEKLAKTPGVLAVTKDELRKLDTASTPKFLGLTGREGFWKQNGARGEDIIIGVVDGGIWPEHPSFSDRENFKPNGEQAYDRVRGWKGTCIAGEQFTVGDCNRKLIGARYYNAGYGGNAVIDTIFPYEFNSPRDYDGHGTHTASTAGGNAGVPATGPTAAFGRISGIAPRARIAAYKVCWGLPSDPNAGCQASDSVKAIDQAVADGVDVINYSISGSRTNFLDPVEQAFLRAADAGVFVAASAGNAGPTASTVAHPSPWIATVAAGTHDRNGVGSATLGNGASYAGASYATAIGPRPLIDASAAGLAGADPANLARCFGAADGAALLDPALVAGKIVLCERGGNVLVNKAQAVKDAGGVGMILANTPISANTIFAIVHVVPAVHIPFIDVTSFNALKAYAASADATATINAATLVFDVPAPFTAGFSSRGPSLAAGGNLLKPDLIAPGQDILAGVAPPGNNGRLFDLLSGTSMSSPHVAGLAALMKEVHPDWSPMAIKSALMTSAGNVLDGPNTDPVVIFSQGAGQVQPNNAADPGLVFDSDTKDWLGFLCGVQQPLVNCNSHRIPVIDPSNLNMASISIGSMIGSQTVTRRVTNVSGAAATYTASVSGMSGFSVTVSPAALTLARGQTKSFTVKITRTTAALNVYTGGQLVLTGGTSRHAYDQHKVRVPMVVKPVAVVAPAQVSGSYSVKFGYTGPFTATPRGLVPATTFSGTIATDDQVVSGPITIPAGTTHARFSLFDADVAPGSDIDLFVLDANFNVVGSSAGETSAEEVNLVNPAAGIYYVVLVGYSVPGTGTSFTQFSWALGSAAAGNMTVTAPAQAVTGQSGTIAISTTGMASGTRYLGAVVYGGSAGVSAPTLVRIDQP